MLQEKPFLPEQKSDYLEKKSKISNEDNGEIDS